MGFRCPGLETKGKSHLKPQSLGEGKDNQASFSLEAFQVLKQYEKRVKHLNKEKLEEPSNIIERNSADVPALSTEEIIKVATTTSLEYHLQRSDNLSSLSFGCAPFVLTSDGVKYVELIQFLIAAAEKVGQQQFDHVSEMLSMCDQMSSATGNPVQRIVYYFTGALRERIDRETGKTTPRGLFTISSNVEEAMVSLSPAILECHQRMPFFQIAQLTGIQAIVESAADAKRLHVIDLKIDSGVQWIALMQALTARNDCPTELLKITAFGTTSMSKIQETGKRLAQFAETVNLPFSFNLVMVLNINDLKKESFELEDGEFIAVYSPLLLKNLLAQPNCLESLMRVIRDLRPQIMVITEPEANHNSQAFKDRFVETLLYFSAIFDCLEACMDRSDPSRMGAEGLYLSYAIKNSIAKEGKERTFQCVKIDYWRAYLAEFGMEETELSMTSLYQAIQVVKKFACGSYCTLDMNGKCLIIGWKGTPINSLSVWKFC